MGQVGLTPCFHVLLSDRTDMFERAALGYLSLRPGTTDTCVSSVLDEEDEPLLRAPETPDCNLPYCGCQTRLDVGVLNWSNAVSSSWLSWFDECRSVMPCRCTTAIPQLWWVESDELLGLPYF